MQFATLDVEKIHVLRVDPGEDLFLSVQNF